MRANDLFDLAIEHQGGDTGFEGTCVVADEGESSSALATQARQQFGGNTGVAEAAHHDDGAIGDGSDRLIDMALNFVYHFNSCFKPARSTMTFQLACSRYTNALYA